MPSKPVRYSVLDLAPVRAGGAIAEALRNTLDLARHAERWGYTRYWLAEHHNMPGIASAATSVLIGYVAGGTSTIRVGSGGIMLPNHAPLLIAEQFGTLETLYPGRIDLGIGRAPGSDGLTSRAIRRTLRQTGDDLPNFSMSFSTTSPPPRPASTSPPSPAPAHASPSGSSAPAPSVPNSLPNSACPSPLPVTSPRSFFTRPSAFTVRSSSPPNRSPSLTSWPASPSSPRRQTKKPTASPPAPSNDS